MLKNVFILTVPVSPSGCPWFKFDCGDGECVEAFMTCDKRKDCITGLDEAKCEIGKYFCLLGRYIWIAVYGLQ